TSLLCDFIIHQTQFYFNTLRVYWEISSKVGEEGWFIFEKPMEEEKGETKYYFSNLPIETPYVKLVKYVHRRYTMERFYQDVKSELGLGQIRGEKLEGITGALDDGNVGILLVYT
ncbi:MAG TPA: hypothetical protein VIK89_09700, partial [Cytophagaceae bacterium]